jgi:hypothetical protein
MGTYTLNGLAGYLLIFKGGAVKYGTGGNSGAAAYFTATKGTASAYPAVSAATFVNGAVSMPIRWGLKRGMVPVQSSD